MQKYCKKEITPEDILPLAERMRKEGCPLAMIHGHVDKDGVNIIAYEFAVGDAIESYQVSGATSLPSISSIYDSAAAWPEREINELMGLEFQGLDMSQRLFLPDNMLDGQGHIIVTSMDELREKNITHREG